ncbi:GNAT family N-acetyltransferase [Sporomusa sp.]|uniref:GNAT family N-acetyltransferase n=1 Tax=Sporomusa sp. TaxID=2078658 RepID=UPI002C9F6A52|nr:GNAT family N-acetyltransferase [Sporomusa sp.]HWR44494.1 GNAT family N-acetyltransferase [Sporomusa sp.]
MNAVQEKVVLGLDANVAGKSGTPAPAVLIRPMQPEEAAAVCRCVYRCYGYSYPNRNMYDPARVQSLNQDGKIISYVAIGYNNELIGHAALELDSDNPTVAEMGNAFVFPEHRGGGLLNEFAKFLVGAAKDRGLAGAFVGSVCSHPYSQKAAHKLGFSDTALCLSRLPHMKFRRLRSGGRCRENILHSFRFFQLDEDLTFYVPKHHCQMVERIYQELGLRVSIQTFPLDLPTAKNTFRSVADSYGAVHVFFTQCDAGIADETANVFYRSGQTEAAYLYLNLADSGTPLLCAEYEKQGYFFAGVLPGSSGFNWLVLQYLRDSYIDYTKLEVASDLGRDLVEYVQYHDPR